MNNLFIAFLSYMQMQPKVFQGLNENSKTEKVQVSHPASTQIYLL